MTHGTSSPWQRVWGVSRIALRRWLAPRTSLFAAALAFHALLALAPMLLVVLAAAGRLLGRESAHRSLSDAVVRFAGPGADRVVAALLALVTEARFKTTGTLLGFALLLYFASSFFSKLRAALDAVWEAPPKGLGRSLLSWLRSYGETIVAVAAVLLVLVAGAFRATIAPLLARSGDVGAFAWVAYTRLGTVLITFAALWAAFRYLPSVRPRPGRAAVLVGAIPAAVLLNVGSDLFGMVIARSAVVSLYGTAASVIMFLLWVQYSALILLLGAELCRAWGESGPGDGKAT
jgi:membrane protein